MFIWNGNILTGTPYSLISLNKSKAAFEYISANADNIDLIMLDLNMHKIIGFEPLEMLKKD